MEVLPDQVCSDPQSPCRIHPTSAQARLPSRSAVVFDGSPVKGTFRALLRSAMLCWAESKLVPQRDTACSSGRKSKFLDRAWWTHSGDKQGGRWGVPGRGNSGGQGKEARGSPGESCAFRLSRRGLPCKGPLYSVSSLLTLVPRTQDTRGVCVGGGGHTLASEHPHPKVGFTESFGIQTSSQKELG